MNEMMSHKLPVQQILQNIGKLDYPDNRTAHYICMLKVKMKYLNSKLT